MSFHLRGLTGEERGRVVAFLPQAELAAGDECLVAEAEKPRRVVGMALLRTRPARRTRIHGWGF